MESVNIHAAKTGFSQLVKRVEGGEEIIIAKAGKPVAKIVPFQPKPKARVGGQLRGQGFWMADDFDAYDEELRKMFEDGPIFPGK